jgi:deoxyribodipyrimidine photo-lyase
VTARRAPAPGPGVVWFRRDLRLGDNPALEAAVGAHRQVVALFVWDPRLTGPAGHPRLAFLRGCVEALGRSLGGSLVVRRGDPARVVPEVAAGTGARAVYCAEDFGPYGRARDERVARALRRHGARLARVGSPYAVAPGRLRTGQGQPYRVFAPYWRAWLAHGWPSPTGRPALGRALLGLPSDPPPPRWATPAQLPDPGEEAAWRALRAFVASGVDGYADQRDHLGVDATSRLSAYLRFGCLHPRQLLAHLDLSLPGHRSFARQLCWREFYADVLFHRPDSARHPYQDGWLAELADQGPLDDGRFRSWVEGRTGYPVVDAGMRQLQAEAWMHNRARMITASFLVKDLGICWQAGARWFMRCLVDGDLASNQHGWQWVAGTGPSPLAYPRLLNPTVQASRFDPDGAYVRRWVPELAGLGPGQLRRPWPGGRLLSAAYPDPIVDHDQRRRELLSRYRAARSSSGPRES